MFRNSFIHKILSEFLQPFWFVGIRVSPYLFVILILIWFGDFSWFMQQLVLLSFVPETRDNIGEERDDEDN